MSIIFLKTQRVMDLLMINQVVQSHDSLRERLSASLCWTSAFLHFSTILAPLEPQGSQGKDKYGSEYVFLVLVWCV